ncbi:hypothetical protein CLOP_g6740, partial [Closterium sp. NIES-67]
LPKTPPPGPHLPNAIMTVLRVRTTIMIVILRAQGVIMSAISTPQRPRFARIARIGTGIAQIAAQIFLLPQ